MSTYQFVRVDQFTPNSGTWTGVGNVTGIQQNGSVLTLKMQSGPGPIITFLSSTLFRVRFNPTASYAVDNSYAVVNRDFGPIAVTVQDQGGNFLIDTGVIQLIINKNPYSLIVKRGNQVLHQDTPTYNMVYIPGQQVVANFKVYPANALYCGFGEKAGSTLVKNNTTLTFFNFDNFMYSQAPLPSNMWPGPLNPTEALYCSVPMLIETNPNPADGGARYSYGLFFDNPGQTYFNIGVDSTTGMFGKYYFGALYGDLDYYFIYGNEVPDIVSQYTHLTGIAAKPARFPGDAQKMPMPPRYVFGYHQGCYGYYSRYILSQVANAYRAARIPIDGLHIDVDFQNNYRTFTSSNLKFPNAKEMFDDLHLLGFKCSTNITPLITRNSLDETGNMSAYPARDSGLALNTPGQPATAFIHDPTSSSTPPLFVGIVGYGSNPGSNPFPAPPNTTVIDAPLGSDGFYPDFGRPDVQAWWGQQYDYLYNQLGMDMVWQDMTCPALKNDPVELSFPSDLQMSAFGNQVRNAQIHNGYVITLLESTFNGLAKLRPTQRNFIIARGGYAGMQRYAGLWTGDSASSWDFLKINIPIVLNLGLSGIPITGCDIGGFANGTGSVGTAQLSGGIGGKILGGMTNYELLTRWMMLGSFLPWYRNHYNGYTKQFQEPYIYGEPVPTNCRQYIELRYRMLHVYYSAMFEATQTGMPICRALFLNDPGDPQVYNHLDDQFFVGRDLLVAPILDPHETANPPSPAQRDIYLPAGSQWYAYKDNVAPLDAPFNGGGLLQNYAAPLQPPASAVPSMVPLFVRAGAILPMRELEQYVGELPQNPITINIYPGADSSFNLYLDDGLSMDADNSGKFRLTQISHTGVPNGQSIRVHRQVDNFTPPEPFFFIGMPGTAPPTAVTAAGANVPNVGQPANLSSSPMNAYYYNSSIQTTFIKIFDTTPDITITATF